MYEATFEKVFGGSKFGTIAAIEIYVCMSHKTTEDETCNIYIVICIFCNKHCILEATTMNDKEAIFSAVQ